MHGSTLFVCALLALCSIALAGHESSPERNALIDAAILEAKEHASMQTAASSDKRDPQGLLRSFKKASRRAAEQGKARLLFEDMINRAEKKLLEAERIANRAILQSDSQAKVEELAKELMHTPGKLLTKQEIARIYQASECKNVLTTADCTNPDAIVHRTLDGTCNNRENPTIGALNTPFRRLIGQRYEDGFNQLRGFMQSQESGLFPHQNTFAPPNPSARVVSVGIIEDRPVNSTEFSHWVMLWGAFLDHDLTLAPEIPVMCPQGCVFSDPSCVPIPVPLDDQNVLTSRVNENARGCHMFRRTIPTCDSVVPSRLTPREQINALNSYIDGEQFYSGDENINNAIRDLDSFGLLKVGPPVVPNGKPSLPVTPDSSFVGGCNTIPNCFLTADVRVNENVALIVIETLWVREHNRIATRLHELNPDWTADKVYLITRDIVASLLQKITYEDYLPILIGDLLDPYFPTGYDSEVDPSVPNSWGTAAHRFGHSQIQPDFERLDESFQSIDQGPLNLVDSFFNPDAFTNGGGTDPFVRGLLVQPIRLVDEFVNSILTNQLFAANQSAMGLDLISLNIQRGRDHGLPPYMVWKRWALKECGVSSEFRNELTKIHLLQTYGSFETIDLWVGGVAEENLPGATLGATFACIFARTFENVRHGDRFYYENDDPETAIFTEQQRDQIRQFSLSRLICDNADDIQQVQPNAFSITQRPVSCSDIPEVDLTAWQDDTLDDTPDEEPTCFIKVAAPDERITVLSNIAPNIFDRFLAVTETVGNEPYCFPFTCPETGAGGSPTELSVFILALFCTLTQNANLPENTATLSTIYLADIFDSDLSLNNGLYDSELACDIGPDIALTYSDCLRSSQQSDDRDALIQTLENILDVQQDDGDEGDGVYRIPIGDPMVPEEVWEEIRRHRHGDNKQSSEKLVGLLQDVLTELKKNDQESMSMMDDSDEDLVSELADALNKLQ